MPFPRQRLVENQDRLARFTRANEFDAVSRDARVAADLMVDGVLRFHHLGLKPIKIGRRNVDWSGKHHNHQEWRCQINRFFILPSLVTAYRETRDEKYAETARDLLQDWIAAHPIPPGPASALQWRCQPYDNTLNLAIRLGMWFSTLPALLASPAFEDALAQAAVDSAAAQIEYLVPRIATHMNWRIAQADALLATGIRLDFHPAAEGWRGRGVRILNEAFQRQVLDDGAHAERNPGYHSWMTTVYERYWRLSRQLPELGLRIETAKLARMFDYVVGVTRPNGSFNAMHDCTGRMTGPASDTWLVARARFRAEAGLEAVAAPLSQWFPLAGQAFLRDAWSPDATCVTFDATTWGGSHCHLSRNAVQVHAFGRSLLIDPGTLTYEASDPKASYGRSTRAHATCNFNGFNQSTADPVSRFDTAPGYDVVRSWYKGGYWPNEMNWIFLNGHGDGLYGEHHRTLIWVRGRFILVIDHLFHDRQADSKPDIQCNWPLSPGPVSLDAASGSAVTGHDDANLLMLFALRPAGTTLRVHEGETNPECGWVPGDNAYAAAPLIRMTTPKRDPYDTHLATLLVPFKGKQPPRVEVVGDAVAPEVDGCGRMVFRWENGDTDEFWFTGRQEVALDQRPGFETDAGLVHLHKDASGKLRRALVVDGTYLLPYTRESRARASTFVVEG
ncbi:MAG: heparinase II/III family protein [Planctomycetota bacterium]|nr:heparinase II/III family protein [Planctomycetota bacterium]